MEADWEVELGGGARVLEPLWPGFVDLRRNPGLANQLQEAIQLPALAGILARLNSIDSPLWTSKCDVWPVADFDPDELDAPREVAHHAMACYIDLLPMSHGQWPTLAVATDWCKEICARMRAVPLRRCRVDFVIRQAILSSPEAAFGITAYLTACGTAHGDASAALAAALATLANSIVPEVPPESAASKLQ